jgi:predicted DNA-binding protein
MKLSENNLHEYIQLYLNDIEDYDSSEQYILAENVLKPVKNLILESKMDSMTMLLEMRNVANSADKAVIDDFILYLGNV